jgi:hypothetical protein
MKVIRQREGACLPGGVLSSLEVPVVGRLRSLDLDRAESPGDVFDIGFMAKTGYPPQFQSLLNVFIWNGMSPKATHANVVLMWTYQFPQSLLSGIRATPQNGVVGGDGSQRRGSILILLVIFRKPCLDSDRAAPATMDLPLRAELGDLLQRHFTTAPTGLADDRDSP